jgi:hypothetical protein
MITLELQDSIPVEEFDTTVLKLLLTGEKGWLDSDKPESGIRILALNTTGSHTLDLHFAIAITQESAVIAFNNKLHAGDFNTSLPVLQAILKFPPPESTTGLQPEAGKDRIAQLHVLQNLRIVGASIRIEVGSIHAPISFDGVRDLLLQNDDAALDPKKPFYPFSASPKVGSAFYIGCKDFFYKKIEQLSLNIAWMLPDNFNTYYQNYLPPYDSNKFVASLSILKNKHWQKIKEDTLIDLAAGEPKFKSIKFDPNLPDLQEASGQPENAIPFADNLLKDGALMLRLDYLDFGHSIYPRLITSAVMEKSASKHGAVDFYKVVKKRLNDSSISIKLPDNTDQKKGPFKVVVYDILDNIRDDERARTMMVNGLSEEIKRFNRSNEGSRQAGQPNEEGDTSLAGEGVVLVNDDNYINRVLGFLKKIKLVDKDVYYDKDKQDTGELVDGVKSEISTVADFIMPSDRELKTVIMNETNNAIGKAVANVVDKLLEKRKEGIPAPREVADLINEEFDQANKAIDDMIASKIALLLSASEVPPPPYSPLISNFSASYSSTKTLRAGEEQFFHITPYGVIAINLLPQDSGAGLPEEHLPVTDFIFPRSLVPDQDPPAQMQGLLFIGIKDLVPPQNLSVLCQVAEGTKRNDKKPPEINWWYLWHQQWKRLPADSLVSDNTLGLQTTGIIEFSMPGEINNKNKLFGTEALYWLCASVVQDTDAFPRLVDLKAQAAYVTFKDQGNDPLHLALPLEAKKINGLLNNVPQVKKVSQPVASFNGRVKEQDQEYYTRVSERLRHKGRAINNWDYERLVLEHFPALFKVKCLNNYYNGHFAIGHVTVVPVSNLQHKQHTGNDLLVPKTSYIDLREIEKLLRARSSPFVKVHAVNPQLDHVHIRCKVKFHTGIDKGYYLQQLNEDLIKYLTPWVGGEADAHIFSAKIYASSIINFIDQRPYVDFVVDLVMNQYIENNQGKKVYCLNEDHLPALVETEYTTGHSILVSAPKHDIELEG